MAARGSHAPPGAGVWANFFLQRGDRRLLRLVEGRINPVAFGGLMGELVPLSTIS